MGRGIALAIAPPAPGTEEDPTTRKKEHWLDDEGNPKYGRHDTTGEPRKAPPPDWNTAPEKYGRTAADVAASRAGARDRTPAEKAARRKPGSTRGARKAPAPRAAAQTTLRRPQAAPPAPAAAPPAVSSTNGSDPLQRGRESLDELIAETEVSLALLRASRAALNS